jgi:hypothetical protein
MMHLSKKMVYIAFVKGRGEIIGKSRKENMGRIGV